MKYGIYFAYWEKEWAVDYLKYVKKVKDLGFDVLEISCAAVRSMEKSDMDALKNEAREYGITLTAGYGPTAQENLSSADDAVVEYAVGFYTGILKKLEYMGIHTIGGGLYSYWPVDFSKPIDKRRDWERSVKNVRRVSQIADACGVDFCLEVLNRYEGYLLNTAEEARRFVEEVDTPAVKIMLDTFHMNIEEDSIPGAIRTAGDKLGHFHVGENNRRCPGKGNLPWPEIGRALRDVGYEKAVVMEPFVMQGGTIGREIKVWRDLCRDERFLDADAKGAVEYLRHTFSGPYSNYSE